MLLRWFVFYPFVYALYNVRNLQRSPWRLQPPQEDIVGILVSNHRNHICDIALAQVASPQWSFFLADASVMRVPLLKWILKAFRVLPVARQRDFRFKTADERRAFNEGAFDQMAELLVQQNWLTIFPEGISHSGLESVALRPGVAKVALAAEEKAGWNLPLMIYVMGINYENQFIGRSDVHVHWAHPIDVRTYREKFRVSPESAEKSLMEEIEKSFSSSAIQHEDSENVSEAYRLAFQRKERTFHGVLRALDDVSQGRAQPRNYCGISLKSGESVLYQMLGFGIWAVFSVIGWPFRVFGRLCANDSSEEVSYMLFMWVSCLIVGGISSGAPWVAKQIVLSWVACTSWLWGWRRGIFPHSRDSS